MCVASSLLSQSRIALVGKQRFENDTTQIPPGCNTRPISRNTGTGWRRYCTLTAIVTAVNDSSS